MDLNQSRKSREQSIHLQFADRHSPDCCPAFQYSGFIQLKVIVPALLALFAPTQLPSGAQKGWAGELLLRVNPVTAMGGAIF